MVNMRIGLTRDDYSCKNKAAKRDTNVRLQNVQNEENKCSEYSYFWPLFHKAKYFAHFNVFQSPKSKMETYLRGDICFGSVMQLKVQIFMNNW